jgi:hypothetical protein
MEINIKAISFHSRDCQINLCTVRIQPDITEVIHQVLINLIAIEIKSYNCGHNHRLLFVKFIKSKSQKLFNVIGPMLTLKFQFHP